MIRISLPEVIEKCIECAHRLAVLLIDLACSQHLHHHRKVLLIFRCFILQIEDKRQKKHLSGSVPKRI